MSRMKTFATYAGIVIAFWIFSELLIYFAFGRDNVKKVNDNPVINNTNTVQNSTVK